MAADAGRRPLLLCLLPARNEAERLPQWLDDAARLCDGVVALDDGSTDETGPILASHPLVRAVLANPRRERCLGWHDGDNRNRLLAAAATLDARWLLFLDADERIDAEDAAALRSFLETDAISRCVYGLQCFRMWEGDRFDPAFEWAFRLFPNRSGLEVPAERFVRLDRPPDGNMLVPIATTVRVQHLAFADERVRATHAARYREADPDGSDPSMHLPPVEPPGRLPPWRARPSNQPVLHAAPRSGPEPGADAPVLTVAVIVADTLHSPDEITVRSLLSQRGPEPVEVLLVSRGAGMAARMSRAFPELELVEVRRRGSRAAALNAALDAAGGEYLMFVESTGIVAAGMVAAVLAAHEKGHTMVAGETSPPDGSPWASAGYLLDHASSLPQGLVGRLDIPPGCCSYARDALLRVGGFPDAADASDLVVNEELARRGWPAWREPEVHLGAARDTPGGMAFFLDRVRLGRALAAYAVESAGSPDGEASASRRNGRPLARAAAIRRHALHAAPATAARYRRVAPLVVAGELCTWAGMRLELARHGRARFQRGG